MFLDIYKKHLNIPFICLARFDNVTKDVAKKLKEAGCYMLELGIESGNEDIRQKILNKSVNKEKKIPTVLQIQKLAMKNIFKHNYFVFFRWVPNYFEFA